MRLLEDRLGAPLIERVRGRAMLTEAGEVFLPYAEAVLATIKDGARIREKLLSLSDYDFTYSYAILDSPMDLSDYVATLRLFPVTEGNRCFIEWSAEFDCAQEKVAELAETVGGGVFQTGLDALKKRYGQR